MEESIHVWELGYSETLGPFSCFVVNLKLLFKTIKSFFLSK